MLYVLRVYKPTDIQNLAVTVLYVPRSLESGRGLQGATRGGKGGVDFTKKTKKNRMLFKN